MEPAIHEPAVRGSGENHGDCFTNQMGMHVSQGRYAEGHPDSGQILPKYASSECRSSGGHLLGYGNSAVQHGNGGDEHEPGSVSVVGCAQGIEHVDAPPCALLKLIPGNGKCFDCAVEGPQWVNTDYGVVLCDACAEIHIAYGLSVKLFSDYYLSMLHRRVLCLAGNKVASFYWMATWAPGDLCLYANSPMEDRMKYILEKYQGKWVTPANKTQLATYANHASPGTANAPSSYETGTGKTGGQDFMHANPPSPIDSIPEAHPSVRARGPSTQSAPSFVMNNMTFYPRKGNGKNKFRR